MGLVLGIDGGGSRTTAAIASAGNVLAVVNAGPSNVRTHGVEPSIAVIAQLVDGLLAKVDPTLRVGSVCAGLAGIARRQEREPVEAWLRSRFADCPSLLVTDVELVLAAGTPTGRGIAVVSGTGSIIFGRNAAGETARAGGWGAVVGDAGSGYAIGRAALAAIADSLDGVRPESPLARLFEQDSGAAGPDRYGPGTHPADVASLAPLVAEAAARGDPTAAGILDDAGAALGEQALAVARRLGYSGAVPAALAGGVIVNVRRVRDALLGRVARERISLAPIEIVDAPVRGALRLASDAALSRATPA